uniref:hypothetical protein n=1 Tax=Ulva meridionalis TaxID=434723 RepID=UPI0028E0A067|nr:hypothetical protein NQY40_pgp030 [Ulva meridionalis]WFS80081.1 hypothetical protein [Ulva meridionalis]
MTDKFKEKYKQIFEARGIPYCDPPDADCDCDDYYDDNTRENPFSILFEKIKNKVFVLEKRVVKSYKVYFNYYKMLIVLEIYFEDGIDFQSEYDTLQDLGLEETNYEDITNMLANDLELFRNLLLENYTNQVIKAYL